MSPRPGSLARVRGSSSWGPWLWSPAWDIAVFGGSAGLALALVAWGHWTGFSERALSPFAFVALVVAVDVAHVYSTLFRTYFDGAELRRRPLRYLGVPLLAYLFGVALYLQGSATFWRVLAYVAVFHFMRQQLGWVAVYRARAGRSSPWDARLDAATVYLATLYPVAYWHGHLDRVAFAWFMPGDFVTIPGLQAALPWLELAWAVALVGFLLRQLWLAWTTRVFQLGKSLVVFTTALTWYLGIVATNSDFDFTVTNVIVHGVPYIALLWSYARCRRELAPDSLGSRVAGAGFAAFALSLMLLAFAEEFAWDRLVWHDHPSLFGEGVGSLDTTVLTLLVPLLSLPQLTHYILDGLLWRRGESRSNLAQRRALGMARGPG